MNLSPNLDVIIYCISLDWIHLAEVTAWPNQRRVTSKTCLQCCTSSEEKGIGSSEQWQELLLKMAKECHCSVRACRTTFRKLSARFSFFLWAGVMHPKEQQEYTFFCNTQLRLVFKLWQWSHRRKHPKPAQSCPTSCPNQALVFQRCHLCLPGN